MADVTGYRSHRLVLLCVFSDALMVIEAEVTSSAEGLECTQHDAEGRKYAVGCHI